MSTIGVIAAVLATLGIILYAVLAAIWRVIHDDGRLRLAEMLRRQGAAPELTLNVGGYQTAIAVRRCMLCARKSECDQWLPSGAQRGMEAFCPTADFVARMSDPLRA